MELKGIEPSHIGPNPMISAKISPITRCYNTGFFVPLSAVVHAALLLIQKVNIDVVVCQLSLERYARIIH